MVATGTPCTNPWQCQREIHTSASAQSMGEPRPRGCCARTGGGAFATPLGKVAEDEDKFSHLLLRLAMSDASSERALAARRGFECCSGKCCQPAASPCHNKDTHEVHKYG